MKTIGAFEAKTHFSELLRNVENGDIYEIRRRGKVVAKLTSAFADRGGREIQETLGFFGGLRKQAHVSAIEVAEWKCEGRR